MPLDAQAFVDELNRRLRADPAWRDDTRFVVASSEGSDDAPTWEGPESMKPVVARIVKSVIGEFRVHYAGFFDPGFGHGDAGGEGSRAVLEVRSYEVPFVLEHGQLVGRLAYERLTSTPAVLYGQGIKSSYQGQGIKLSKHFKAVR